MRGRLMSPAHETQSMREIPAKRGRVNRYVSPIWCGFAPSFVNYKQGCTRLAAANGIVYQLLAHGQWFSPGIPASSTTKTGRHNIAEILLKVALSTINQSI